MNTLEKRAVVLAAGLSALAGFVDATGFLQLRGTFVSFMSGNSTLLAIALTRGDIAAIVAIGGIVALFVTGVMLGTLVARKAPRARQVPIVLGFVTLLLLVSALGQAAGLGALAVAVLTIAMGAENATFQRDGEVVIGLTYMTGTLVRIGQKMAEALSGGPRWAWTPFLWLWLGLIAGGCLGARAYGLFGLGAISIAAVWAAVMTFFAWQAKISMPSTTGRVPK
ncbi:MAG: YoaK family protein [Asticcacaulis sp.]